MLRNRFPDAQNKRSQSHSGTHFKQRNYESTDEENDFKHTLWKGHLFASEGGNDSVLSSLSRSAQDMKLNFPSLCLCQQMTESIRHADQGIRIHKCRSINNAFVNHKNLRYSVHSHCLQETWKATFHVTESPVLNRINSWSEERKVDTPNQQFVMLVITDNNGSGTKSQWGGFTGRWGQKTSTRDSKFT